MVCRHNAARFHILDVMLESKDVVKSISATTCDFQQCGILTSVDSEEPVQPSVNLRNSKCCSVSSLTVIKYSSH